MTLLLCFSPGALCCCAGMSRFLAAWPLCLTLYRAQAPATAALPRISDRSLPHARCTGLWLCRVSRALGVPV